MCFYLFFIDYILPILSFLVASIACIYTFKTFKQSQKIQNTLAEEKLFRWNKKELENLFRTLPISSIDSFFQHPNIISDELWQGIGVVDLNTFQYNGRERAEIEKFINKIFEFSLLNYKQTSSKNWIFQPLNSNEPFDAEIERNRINEIESKAAALKPLYDKVKNVLFDYQIDIREINAKASDFYKNKIQEIEMIKPEISKNLIK